MSRNTVLNTRLQSYRNDFQAARFLSNKQIRQLANTVNVITKKRVVSPHWTRKTTRVRDYGSRDSVNGKTRFIHKYIHEYTDQVFTDRQLAHIFDYDNGLPTHVRTPDDCDFYPLTQANLNVCEGFKFTMRSYKRLFPNNPYDIPEDTKRLIICLPSEMDMDSYIEDFLMHVVL